MCHKFTPLTFDEVDDALEAMENGGRAQVHPSERAREDAWPGSLVAVVDERDGRLSCVEFTWGFTKPEGMKGSGLIFNARLEKLLEQEASGFGLWSGTRRCVVPARAFSEPSKGGDVSFGAERMPIFLMAGVYRDDRLAIVTVPADAQVGRFHPRMPLILPRGFTRNWIHGSVPCAGVQTFAEDRRPD